MRHLATSREERLNGLVYFENEAGVVPLSVPCPVPGRTSKGGWQDLPDPAALRNFASTVQTITGSLRTRNSSARATSDLSWQRGRRSGLRGGLDDRVVARDQIMGRRRRWRRLRGDALVDVQARSFRGAPATPRCRAAQATELEEASRRSLSATNTREQPDREIPLPSTCLIALARAAINMTISAWL